MAELITKVGDSLKKTCTYAVDEGFLECNGAAISRTAYPELFAKIGTLYGVGDGSATFNLPDFRGRFLRGSGGDNAAAIGTAQGDAIRNITGEFALSPTGRDTSIATNVASGAFYIPYPSGDIDHATNYSVYSQKHGIGLDASLVVPTAAENRPINYAIKLCIKY